MGKAFNYERAEQEANKIGLEFANSNDVVKDMSRAYNVDFSNIKVHTDSAADNKVKAAGKDALAQGNDIFFGKGIFESSDPADKGLVAHEFAHTMQQGAAMGGEMAVAESAPMGVAQGGIKDWFKRKKKTHVANGDVTKGLVNENKIPMAGERMIVRTSSEDTSNEFIDAAVNAGSEYNRMLNGIREAGATGKFSADEMTAMLAEIQKAKEAGVL